MFGLSPTKILFTIVVVVLVWKGFKWFGQLQEMRARNDGTAQGDRSRASNRSGGDGGPVTEDMVKCGTCGDYVPGTRAVSCGRNDCPYPG